MSILTKIERGTTPSGWLCPSCSKSIIMSGEDGNDRVYCNATWGDGVLRLHERVVRCNSFSDRTEPTQSLEAMKSQAYILGEYGPLKTVGFVSPKQWRKDHPDAEVIGDD